MAERVPATMDALNPPRINTQDASAAQDISDASDDHFSSASEGGADPHRLSTEGSPVPITRVERVDDKALHGEVPGTPAYSLRTQDAVPDEIEIVPEGRRSRSATTNSQGRGRALSQLSAGSGSRSGTPGGSPVPKTVVEKVDFKPAHGEIEGTPAKDMRMADAIPDEVRKAPADAGKKLEGRDEETNGGEDSEEIDDEDEDRRQAWFRNMWEGQADDRPAPTTHVQNVGGTGEEDDDDDFGDDFDEFAEGDGDDDFGDFDEAEEAAAEESQPVSKASAFSQPTPDVLADLPPLDLSTCTTPQEITDQITPYINAILPDSSPLPSKYDLPPLDPSQTTAFSSERSLSLWQQLVSPPPMQPPNWTRSRIRRLFLVSLGVPVDLDEILPPSKQKRLVLPSIGLEGEPVRASTAIERLKSPGRNDSSTSLDSKGHPKPSRTGAKSKAKGSSSRPGPPPPPEFDTNAATLLCGTTEEALSVYTDGELKEHVFTLRMLNERASKVLEYWLQRKDEGLKEKEALEGVIENLVGFVKGRRGK